VSYRIGVFHKKNRNWHKNITRHDHERFTFKKFYDTHRIINAVRRRIGKGAKQYYKYSRTPPSYPTVDLYHHWRALDFGSTPWVVSTSSGLPFGWPWERCREGLKLLASEACKRILVTGRCALEWQRRRARREPDLESAVMDKVEILPPPQDLLVSDWKEKPVDLQDPLRLAFVGTQFFLKGGLELIRVVQQLVSEGAAIELDIVSELKMSDRTGDTEEDLAEARRIIEECPRITWHGRLPNDRVLELFRQSHIGLLPSYIEGYGYTVLEAQAGGCPMITTDIKAFPDTNPDEVGWRIQIDGEEYDYESPEGQARISKRIEDGLDRILRQLLEDCLQIREKGIAALDRIEKEHSPARHGERLRTIYREALDD
jgi:glycosyltransferase involved in cell wall biosynthesis